MTALTLTPAFHFRVDFISKMSALTTLAKHTPLGKVMAADIRFQQVSGLDFKIDKSDFREGGQLGNPHILFNKVEFPELVLKRGLAVGYSQVSHWFDKTMTELQCIPQDILVSLLNADGLPVRAWLVETAFPSAWQLGELNAEQNAMAIETLSINYENFIPMNIGTAL